MTISLKAGDRIRLNYMPDDPNPIPSGTEGTVTGVNEVKMMRPPFTQVGVKWDNGRTLSLCVPPDLFTVISRASDQPTFERRLAEEAPDLADEAIAAAHQALDDDPSMAF